jgi:hypothetical protein
MDRIKLVIERKPPPPALDPFECLACRKMIERDPYTPDFQAPPVCWACVWAEGGRTQLGDVPFSAWTQFRTVRVIINLIDREAARARQH